VTVVDMSTQRLHGDTSYLSFTLKKEIDLRLEAEQQAILFLNRRGYSRSSSVLAAAMCRLPGV